jgi:hypothetical protein
MRPASGTDRLRQHPVEGTTGLERPGVLEQLQFGDHLDAVQIEAHHRCATDPSGDPLGGLLDESPVHAG